MMATANTRRNTDADTDDLYVTLPEHTAAFFDVMARAGEPVFNPGHLVWEPCAGRGDIARYVESQGFNVWATDLNRWHPWGYGIAGVNILQTDFTGCHNLITNPPFGILNDILRHILPQLPNGARVSMLVRLASIETQERVAILKKYGGLKLVMPYAYRIGCPKVNKQTGELLTSKRDSSAVAYTWLHWQKGYTGRPQIEWIT